MRRISLTRGYATWVDDDVYPFLGSFKWCVKPHGRTAYAIRRLGLGNNKQTTVYLHHWIIGFPLNNQEVDHIDGNGLNNTRENLRIVSHTVNSQNQHQPKSSRVLGVIWDAARKQWQVRLKSIFHGRFQTEKEAAAYSKFLRRYEQ